MPSSGSQEGEVVARACPAVIDGEECARAEGHEGAHWTRRGSEPVRPLPGEGELTITVCNHGHIVRSEPCGEPNCVDWRPIDVGRLLAEIEMLRSEARKRTEAFNAETALLHRQLDNEAQVSGGEWRDPGLALADAGECWQEQFDRAEAAEQALREIATVLRLRVPAPSPNPAQEEAIGSMSERKLVVLSEEQLEALRAANTGSRWRQVLDDLVDSYEAGITVEEARAADDWIIGKRPHAADSLAHGRLLDQIRHKFRTFTERNPDADH